MRQRRKWKREKTGKLPRGKQRKKSNRLHSNLGQFSRTVHAVMGIVRTLKGIPLYQRPPRRHYLYTPIFHGAGRREKRRASAT